jgi:hypothetical protein
MPETGVLSKRSFAAKSPGIPELGIGVHCCVSAQTFDRALMEQCP